MTAHKLLYKAKQLPNGKYYFEPREELDDDYKVIVVDEVSMITQEMWDLLLSHRVYVLATGDPGQLKPVQGNTTKVLDNPHVFLHEIMRQAQESEIIRLSMHIRDNRPLATFPCQKQDVQIFNQWELTDDMLLWADQIICATNDKRHELNKYMRQLKGFSNEPQIGDKIIGLHNEWDFLAEGDDEIPLTNGTIGEIINIRKSSLFVPRFIKAKSAIPILYVDMISEDGHLFKNIPIDYTCLQTGKPFLNEKQTMQMKKSKQCDNPPFVFAYSYAISCHKSQGSQWERVLLIEEGFPYKEEDHRRWAYTGCTRASERCVIIKK